MKYCSAKFLLGAIALASITGFLFVWFGVFNVSANEKHWDITTAFLETVKNRSIQNRIEDIEIPDLKKAEFISNGAQNYSAMCAQCHLAPGEEESELYLGLYPQPPVFYEHDVTAHDPRETFWIIKNGLKMTGMPAWGEFHSDKQIWELVAIVSELNGMSPEKYKELAGDGKHVHANGGHGQQGHHDAPKKKTESHTDEDKHDSGHQH